jgi:Uncharacterized protein conserved in bacteria
MFFKKKKLFDEDKLLSKVAALLIHTAKIDEEYSHQEDKIIKETMLELGVKQDKLEMIIEEAKKMEANSNQILDFTKEVKNLEEQKKIRIIEVLWQIIYSNKVADMYETNLMRRLGGLLYIDTKIMGDIKDKIKNKNS